MKLLDLASEDMLNPLLAILRELTRADVSREALTRFTVGYGRHRPVERFVTIRPDHSSPGGFRIIFDHSLDEMVASTFRPARDMTDAELNALPVYRGGFIGFMIADGRPKLALDIQIASDPHLSDGAKRLPSCMALPVYRGEQIEEWVLGFSSRVDGYTSRDVIQGVLVSNMLGVANRQIDTVSEVSRLNAQMRDQLDQIARLQQALLPNSIPHVPGLEIATSYLSSDQAGGDYYDFFHLGEHRLGIMIADVSGHGAAAATIMAMLHAIVHCYEPDGDFSPADALDFANRRLIAAGLDGQFITAFLAVVDTRTGLVTYANAGHPPPIVKRGGSGGEAEVVPGDATFPLGILDNLHAPECTVQLGYQDTLLLFTDGITEAFNPAREMYGLERLRASLVHCTGAPDCAVDHVHKGLYTHRGAFTRDDDQTIVAVRFHGICEIAPAAATQYATA